MVIAKHQKYRWWSVMIDHQSPCSWKLKESRIEAHVSWLPDSHHIIRLMIIMIVMMIIMIIKLIMNGNMVLMINRKENICLSNCSYWQWPPWWPRPFHAKLSFCPAHWHKWPSAGVLTLLDIVAICNIMATLPFTAMPSYMGNICLPNTRNYFPNSWYQQPG